ncbi:MAG: propionyl-CoA synthetase [Bacteroidota bacterium]
MKYQDFFDKSIDNKETFWQEQAKEISWFEFPENILSKDEAGLYRWFKGGKLNTCYLALDHHIAEGRGAQTALIYDSPVSGQQKKFTYQQLKTEVEKVAAGLLQLGVSKGDRVIIYMPMIPEVAFAMLACARLGAIHSVVFGGFSAHELAIRIDDAKPKVVLTASCGIEISKIISYKPIVDAALIEAQHQPEKVVVFLRPQAKADLQPQRDLDWQDFTVADKKVDCVPVDAIDPLYILYTSGTTGVPKGIVRDNGGHAVAMKFSMRYIYGVEPGDVYWAASDVGWVVGHSYIVYGPLIHGCTSILFEGKPIKTPDPGTFFRLISEHQVKVLFTAPTAFRAIRKEDPEGQFKKAYDTSCLQYLFLAGERCDVSTLEWCGELLNVPVIDHWWQTESGSPMLANPVGMELLPIKPGSAAKPVCGYDIQILDENGHPAAVNTEGAVVVKLPLPPGALPSLWRDDERFQKSYLTAFPGYYLSGDGGYRDEEGYVFITGRTDDIINVAGHRLSTAEMEEVVASHPAVAECAVIGIHDQLKGQIPVGFYVLQAGVDASTKTIEEELIQMVRKTIGPVASFKRAVSVARLPKTRSGKILRKIMRAIADGKPFSPPSTIEDITVLDELKALMAKEKVGVAFL